MRFKFGIRSLLFCLLTILLNVPLVWPLNCEKTFTYYEEYGQNSFNVSCNGITRGYEHILENITINNEISLTVSNSLLEGVTSNIFKNMRNIKILSIFNSTLEFSKELAIFEKLEKLETLILQDVPFQIHNITLRGLHNLKRLELINNGIATIGEDGLKHLVSLEKFSLTDNYAKSIANLQLCELEKLKYLDLKRNLLNNLKTFSFFCSKSTKQLELEENNVSPQPNVPQLPNYVIKPTTYNLVELDISFNQIVELAASLENLQKLRVLNVGFNKIARIDNKALKQLFMLQKLNFTHNELRTFDTKTFTSKKQLSNVDLSHNYLASFNISDLDQLQYLDLGYNLLTTISIQNLTELTTVHLPSNKLRTLTIESFYNVPKLTYLNLAGNSLNLSEPKPMFSNLTALTYLSLRNNSIKDISVAALRELKTLRTLDLSENQLSNLKINTFVELENIETLNLSKNSIKFLSYPIMKPLKNLRTLDLGSNKLLHIEYDVILLNLPRLSNINIKSNQLTCEDLGKIISFLKQKHIVYTSSEHFENLNQNVAGIPCKPEIRSMLVSVEATSSGHGALYNFGIFLVVTFSAVLTGIASYRFYIYLKRRRYRADEFELVVE